MVCPGRMRYDPLHVFQIAFDLLDQPVEVRADAQHLGAAVIQDVCDLGRREAPVDAHRHRTGFRRTKYELIEQVRVLVEKADAAARAQSFGQKRVRNLVRLLVELTVRGRSIFVLERDLVRSFARMKARQFGERADIVDVRHLSVTPAVRTPT